MSSTSTTINTSISNPINTPVNTIYEDGRYLADNPDWHAQDAPWKAQQVLKMMALTRLEPQTIVEVGCGSGQVITELARRLPQTSCLGLEPSPQARALCSRQADLKEGSTASSKEGHPDQANVRFEQRSLPAEGSTADLLLCIDVFEHVSDPCGFISELATRAKHLIFHIPLDLTVVGLLKNDLMRSRRQLGHLHYYTRDTALATLEESGCTVEQWFYTPWFKDLPARGWKSALARLPRQLLYSINPDALALWLGGCSLMVCARGRASVD